VFVLVSLVSRGICLCGFVFCQLHFSFSGCRDFCFVACFVWMDFIQIYMDRIDCDPFGSQFNLILTSLNFFFFFLWACFYYIFAFFYVSEKFFR
jgi:hypothetical protein